MATRTVLGICGTGGSLRALVKPEADGAEIVGASEGSSGTTGATNIGVNRAISITTEISLEFCIIGSPKKGYFPMEDLE
jgi:hypothetical protein